jgi:hypothetical protein
VVDDDLIAAVGTERCLDGLGDRLAGLDIANDGAIFSIVTVTIAMSVTLIISESLNALLDLISSTRRGVR